MLKIGILGAARVAVYALLDPAKSVKGCRVTAVAARDPERARAYATQHGIPHVHASYADLIASSDVDLVYVATPPHNHSELAEATLRAGKPVLVEKPFAMNEAQADAIFRLAREKGLAVFEAMHSPHHPLLARVRSLMDGGAIGELLRIDARFDAPIARTQSEFRWYPELGGGALLDLGVYPLTWCRRLAGEAFEVEDASAVIAGVDTSFGATLRFASGVEAVISSSLFGESHRAPLRIEGSIGHLEIDNFVAPHRGHSLVVHSRGGCRVETIGQPTSYQAQLEAVVQTLVTGAPFPFPPDDYVRSMRAIDAIRLAWSSGG